MRVGQLSESDAVDALRLPFSSSRHARGSNRRAITLIWGIPACSTGGAAPGLHRAIRYFFILLKQ